ncbi:MAG: STAS domain-containing protein [bacterium]|jgi:anti-sigma B factor antagonist|nr:STAS domain-containing protein [bacterium]
MIDINVSRLNTVTLVEVKGRVDSMNANQLGEALSGEIDGGNIQVVLDLAQVDYMSSAGLREIVAALKKVKRATGDMRIAQPSERVREVLEMAGLDTIFQIFDSKDGAVQSY